jgi:ubiquinone/menaquinone biosynthesis C-methylase UbiE
MMDDFTIGDPQLERALEELRWVNRLLGGYTAVRAELKPLLRRRRGGRISILDLGTGIADYAEAFVVWGDRAGVEVSVSAVDANPSTVEFARRRLSERLPVRLRQRIEVCSADALRTNYPSNSFDVVTASLFLHHMGDEDAVALLREMGRIASEGIVVNDLHRHTLAYLSIKGISIAFPVSSMFRNDGPLSVRRAFTRSELEAYALQAGLQGVRIRWRWAFRWVLSTIPA